MLLAGGGHADIPMIKAAQALGFHVTTSGNRASDLGHAYADDVQLADFSDRQAILNLARHLDIDALMSSCNDFSALSCAWAAEKLGLPGHDRFEVARLLHHKDLYRAFALENQIPTPLAISCSSVRSGRAAAAKMTFPLIVKPVDLTGGKGISVAQTVAELDESLARALSLTRAGRVVVEEFIEGTRHGFTCIIRDRRIVFHFQDDEHYFLNPYMVSGASTPSSAPAAALAELAAIIEFIAEKLQLTDGIVHVQFILSGDKPSIIEICRRPPGDLYVDLVKHATGVDYPSLIVRPSCGLDFDNFSQNTPNSYFTRHCIMSQRQGRIDGLEIHPSVAAKIVDQMLWWKKGDVIEDVMTHKLGIIFLKFDTQSEMGTFNNALQDLVKPRLS